MLSYLDVPKEPLANQRFRLSLLRKCVQDPLVAAGVKELCRRDILFWINCFCWTYDPRKIQDGQSPHIPWITWPYQDEVILKIKANFGKRRIGIQKARDMGATWMCLGVCGHEWQFEEGRSIMVMSRNERLVDWLGSTDTLFSKLDYLIERQPSFLLPRYSRDKLNYTNHDQKCNLTGSSTTEEAGRGGRRTTFFIDEFDFFKTAESHEVISAVSNNTNCVLMNSTFKGSNGAFSSQMKRTDIVKIALPWTLHPEHAAGITYSPQGKPTSPWYEEKSRDLVLKKLIARELDMDESAASGQFFDEELIERCLADCCAPFDGCTGTLEEDEHGQIKFVSDPRGYLRLWCFPDAKGQSPVETYFVGIDVSSGTGSTNSVASGVSRRTGEKIAEIAISDLAPEKFAVIATRLASWLNDAEMIWEMQGPGGVFGKKVIELGYRNVYYRRDEQGLTQKVKPNLIPGWNTSPQNQEDAIRAYASALGNGQFINRCREAILECKLYVYREDGSIGNIEQRTTTDPSGARKNHADRPTADMLACKLLLDAGPMKLEEQQEFDPFDPPEGTLAYRKRQRQLKEDKKKQWCPNPTPWTQTESRRW